MGVYEESKFIKYINSPNYDFQHFLKFPFWCLLSYISKGVDTFNNILVTCIPLNIKEIPVSMMSKSHAVPYMEEHIGALRVISWKGFIECTGVFRPKIKLTVAALAWPAFISTARACNLLWRVNHRISVIPKKNDMTMAASNRSHAC